MSEELGQTCRTCYCFGPLPAVGPGVCRLAPPQPILVGMQQGAAGLAGLGKPSVQPLIKNVQSQVLSTGWCAQWRPRTYDGTTPPLPGAAIDESRYRT